MVDPPDLADVSRVPPLSRWLWIPLAALLLGWYFLGYFASLDSYLAPLLERWPILETLLAWGRP